MLEKLNNSIEFPPPKKVFLFLAYLLIVVHLSANKRRKKLEILHNKVIRTIEKS